MSTIQRKPRSAHMTCTGGGLATVAATALASLAFAAPSLADEQPASAAAAGGSQANASGPVLPPPPIPHPPCSTLTTSSPSHRCCAAAISCSTSPGGRCTGPGRR